MWINSLFHDQFGFFSWVFTCFCLSALHQNGCDGRKFWIFVAETVDIGDYGRLKQTCFCENSHPRPAKFDGHKKTKTELLEHYLWDITQPPNNFRLLKLILIQEQFRAILTISPLIYHIQAGLHRGGGHGGPWPPISMSVYITCNHIGKFDEFYANILPPQIYISIFSKDYYTA